MLRLRLPREVEERLTALAKKTGCTKSYHACVAILEHIGDIEDAYIAAERLKKPGKRWSLNDIERERDLKK